MRVAYLTVTLVFALLVSFAGIGKLRRGAHLVQVIQTVGFPLKYLPWLAACEFAGGAGLVAGIWWPLIGIAAAIGLVLYFLGAIVSHLRVGDVKGIGAAAFLCIFAVAALTLRVLTGS